jgi:hypothetical protein
MSSPRKSRQPKLTKAEVKKLDAAHIPHVEEAWDSYHQAVLMLIEQDGDPDTLEETRNFATYYYEVLLDLLIGTRKTKLND